MTIVKRSENTCAASKDALACAVRVLETEGRALLELAQFLDDRFMQAIDIVSTAEGRVIVTGMGKSGHVGRKIAATLASTGTPAFFVHPAEASHGDMGMIVRGDVVLALSNSGEAKELNDLIEYTRRFAIPLLAVTSRPQSTLATRSDIALLLPPCPEACPNGLAPTTSTTMTLALGDALAIALLEKKGFTAKDFKVYLAHALGSANEILVHLRVAQELGYLSQEETRELMEGYNIVGRQLNKLIQNWR
jgi:arabinose-5-phosphate isomerase